MQFPSTQGLPVRHLAAAFRRTTNSYKFYWLLALLHHLEGSTERVMSVNELVARMIAAVWYPIDYYRLSLGKQDRLARLVYQVKQVSQLPADAARHDVKLAALEQMEGPEDVAAEIRSIRRYVPFRFLTPWFRNELHGMRDYKKNARIEALAASSFESPDPSLYRFVEEAPEKIELHPRWSTYLRRHSRLVTDFCLWNLTCYLQSKNPNVPNIAEKLFRPEARDLRAARRFWNLALDVHSEALHCPYSCESLKKGRYDVDHFIPWRFVSHDQLWNLAPTTEEANRGKGDALPDLDAYFDNFAALQHTGFRTAYAQGKERWLEDYALLFADELSEVESMGELRFRSQLRDQIIPLMQIAANRGFPAGWTYRSK